MCIYKCQDSGYMVIFSVPVMSTCTCMIQAIKATGCVKHNMVIERFPLVDVIMLLPATTRVAESRGNIATDSTVEEIQKKIVTTNGGISTNFLVFLTISGKSTHTIQCGLLNSYCGLHTKIIFQYYYDYFLTLLP